LTVLDRRPLGKTGEYVTALGYGAMELRGKPRGRDLSETEVGRILNTVLDSGIGLIDTAIDYEESEERIGRHVSHRRDEYLLASKCGCLVGWERPADYAGGMPGGGPHDFSRENLIAGLEQSLRRLRTDHLDILQVHASPDRETLERYQVVETLQEMQRNGKVRFIGMSGVLPSVMDHIDMAVFDTFQMPYSALEREHEPAIARAATAGAGVLVRGGAGRGAPSGEHRAVKKSPKLAAAWQSIDVSDLLDGMSPMEFTLRFTLSNPDASSVLIGTANLAHLESNVAAMARGPLPADLYELATGTLSA
jgi:aryl-alcohol dehydrogenase-like predicted oxidoreductase